MEPVIIWCCMRACRGVLAWYGGMEKCEEMMRELMGWEGDAGGWILVGELKVGGAY